MVSLAVRHWRRAGFDKAVFLSTAGVALAWVTGGALFAAVLVGFVLFTHWIALAIERAADRRQLETPSRSRPARAWLVVAVAVARRDGRGDFALGSDRRTAAGHRRDARAVRSVVLRVSRHLVCRRRLPRPRRRDAQPTPACGVSAAPAADRRRPAGLRGRGVTSGARLAERQRLFVRGAAAGHRRLESVRHGRSRRPAGRRGVRAAAGAVECVPGVVGAGQLHVADVLRVLRLFRHGDRARTDARPAPAREFPLALRRRDGRRVLAALASRAVRMVS